ncbi:hypothetical protein HAX54_033032 [Datura stramonium]|uniref:Uncharacterized protein n=1 Tax=Datura stramonium TaxID=4076 RepID=A0ABS8VD57_DATST|nr:hypothetical protein [Datura stramonium]
MVPVRALFENDENIVQCHEGDNILRSGNLRRDRYGNPSICIGNERRSGGTCGITYWIIPVRHEAADAESAPMPLAMHCLVPLLRHGGGSIACHVHRDKGRLSNSIEPPYLIPT